MQFDDSFLTHKMSKSCVFMVSFVLAWNHVDHCCIAALQHNKVTSTMCNNHIESQRHNWKFNFDSNILKNCATKLADTFCVQLWFIFPHSQPSFNGFPAGNNNSLLICGQFCVQLLAMKMQFWHAADGIFSIYASLVCWDVSSETKGDKMWCNMKEVWFSERFSAGSNNWGRIVVTSIWNFSMHHAHDLKSTIICSAIPILTLSLANKHLPLWNAVVI